jgi:sirohydrochlorin ferrochelatase
MRKAILLIDHGSKRSEANDVLEKVSRLVRRALPETIVRHAHMELAPPTLSEAFDACVAEGAEEIIVHPYFLVPGDHTTRDIPRLAAEAASRHPGMRVKITDPIGAHEKIGDVIVERVGAARDLKR